MHTAVLVHSPFLGPASMQALAGALRIRGRRAVVVDLRDGLRSSPCHDGFAERFAAAAPHGPHLLVGHSGIGPYLPLLARGHPDSVAVYVDAGLPTPGQSWHDTAPAELHDQLAGLAGDDGCLPPWHTWFDPSPLTSDALRAAIASEAPRVPLRFLAEPRPHTDEPPSAYLRLSAPYDGAAHEAAARGWPTRSRDADHLALVTAPELVASEVEELARALT